MYTIYYIPCMLLQEKTTKSLENQLSQLQQKACGLFPMMRGSVVYTGMKDKQPKYSLRYQGKTKFMYLGKQKETIAKEYIDNYKTFQEIVDQMTLINMELIRRSKGSVDS